MTAAAIAWILIAVTGSALIALGTGIACPRVPILPARLERWLENTPAPRLRRTKPCTTAANTASTTSTTRPTRRAVSTARSTAYTTAATDGAPNSATESWRMPAPRGRHAAGVPRQLPDLTIRFDAARGVYR